MIRLLRPRNWEPACGTERSAASANNMAVLPCALGCSFGQAQDKLTWRRTIQVRLGTNPAVPRDGRPEASPPRLSQEGGDGGQARPSSWSRDSDS
jgi:hypothetical protein